MSSHDAPYVSGVCNVGREEAKQRLRLGWVALATTIVAWGLLATSQTAAPWRLLLFFPAAIAAMGFLQSSHRFCAMYGLVGAFNFGPVVGRPQRIEDRESRRQDRRIALRIIARAALAAAAVAAAAYFIPL